MAPAQPPAGQCSRAALRGAPRQVDRHAVHSTQQDPIGLAGGLNLYGYAGGDPINFDDPFGLCPAIPQLCTAAIGAVVGGGAQAVSNYIGGRPLGENVVQSVALGAVIGLTLGAAAPQATAAFAARAGVLGAGAAVSAAGGTAAASKLTIEFGKTANQLSHAMRHVEAAGLDAGAVRAAIGQHLPTVANQLKQGQPLNQVITVGGQQLQYTAYQIAEGVVNVGRIHPVP